MPLREEVPFTSYGAVNRVKAVAKGAIPLPGNPSRTSFPKSKVRAHSEEVNNRARKDGPPVNGIKLQRKVLVARKRGRSRLATSPFPWRGSKEARVEDQTAATRSIGSSSLQKPRATRTGAKKRTPPKIRDASSSSSSSLLSSSSSSSFPWSDDGVFSRTSDDATDREGGSPRRELSPAQPPKVRSGGQDGRLPPPSGLPQGKAREAPEKQGTNVGGLHKEATHSQIKRGYLTQEEVQNGSYASSCETQLFVEGASLFGEDRARGRERFGRAQEAAKEVEAGAPGPSTPTRAETPCQGTALRTPWSAKEASLDDGVTDPFGSLATTRLSCSPLAPWQGVSLQLVGDGGAPDGMVHSGPSASAAGGSPSTPPLSAGEGVVASPEILTAGRSSTQLITKAAATRPTVSPGTLWIRLDDDDDPDDAETILSNPTLRYVRIEPGAVPAGEKTTAVQRGGSQGKDSGGIKYSAATSASENEPISQVLSPTFRPRRRGLQSTPTSYFIHLDDNDDGDENATNEGQAWGEREPFSSSTTLSYVEKEEKEAHTSGKTSEAQHALIQPSSERGRYPHIIDDDPDEIQDGVAREGYRRTLERKTSSVNPTPRACNNEEDENEEGESIQSPSRSVRDFLFPSRSATKSGTLLFPPPDPSTTGGNGGRHRLRKGRGPAERRRREKQEKEGWGRPVDQLGGLFPNRFTRKTFIEASKKVIPAAHFLETNEFWDAFATTEFLGEGSFGLVWRCRTIDGDLVAVKSCPVSLATRANIEDAFSTLREIATMRFLGDMQVPYVLPLHSAFFMWEAQALPPLAAEALAWRREQQRIAKARVLERQVQMLSVAGHVYPCYGKRGGRGNPNASTRTFEDEVEEELLRMWAAETPVQREFRERMQRVKLPRFLSITEDEVLQCDATVFLVTELCDGDIEAIPRGENIVKGVAYCISAALTAMHRLGLLHLDLKPSNILFAYEHGPSQADAQPSLTGAGPVIKFYLSDFGNCRIAGPNPHDTVSDAYGTFEYMDLPALKDTVCSRATDMFSLGSSLYEILFGKRVYSKCTNPKCLHDNHTRHCFVPAAKKTITLPLGEATTAGGCGDTIGKTLISKKGPSTSLHKLIAALLNQNTKERITAAQCCEYVVRVFHFTQTNGI